MPDKQRCCVRGWLLPAFHIVSYHPHLYCHTAPKLDSTQVRTHSAMKWAATLTVAAAALCLSSAQTTCPDGWANVGGDTAPVCMYFVRLADTYNAMKTYCKAIGGNLAKLTGNLHQLVVDYIKSMPDGDLNDETFWIGGSDEVTEGNWKWDIDWTDIPQGPPHWYLCSDQPSGGTKKNYLCLDKPDFYFHSCTGDHTYLGICQI